MRPFTDEEFEIMISELAGNSHQSFDMLSRIAEKTLRPSVKAWCDADRVLCGMLIHDDIMQKIHMRLIKTVVTHFLKRADMKGEINRDPDGFKNWMFTVAKRIFVDEKKAVLKGESLRGDVPDKDLDRLSYELYYGDDTARKQEILSGAFKIVLDADAKVYKVLTWLAQSLFIVEYKFKKHQSNRAIVKAFSEKTLFEMRDILLRFAKKKNWITVDRKQLDKIENALNTDFHGRLMGEFKYKELFMKKGGKATVSDWVNRMNRLIWSRMEL